MCGRLRTSLGSPQQASLGKHVVDVTFFVCLPWPRLSWPPPLLASCSCAQSVTYKVLFDADASSADLIAAWSNFINALPPPWSEGRAATQGLLALLRALDADPLPGPYDVFHVLTGRFFQHCPL